MLAQVPKIASEVVTAAGPKVVELIILDPIIVRAGIKKSTVAVIAVVSFLLGAAVNGLRNRTDIDSW